MWALQKHTFWYGNKTHQKQANAKKGLNALEIKLSIVVASLSLPPPRRMAVLMQGSTTITAERSDGSLRTGNKHLTVDERLRRVRNIQGAEMNFNELLFRRQAVRSVITLSPPW